MYTPRGLQYILQVYCYYVEVYVQYGQGTLKAAVYGIYCKYTVLMAVYLQYNYTGAYSISTALWSGMYRVFLVQPRAELLISKVQTWKL